MMKHDVGLMEANNRLFKGVKYKEGDIVYWKSRTNEDEGVFKIIHPMNNNGYFLLQNKQYGIIKVLVWEIVDLAKNIVNE